MPVIGTVNLPSASDGKIIPVSVSRLADGTYALIVDERSVHNIGVSGAAAISADASVTPAPITDSPAAGEKIVVDEIIVSCGQPNLTVDFIEEVTTKIILRLYLTNNGAINFIGNDRMKLSAPNQRLMMKTSAAGNISCTALWYSEP